MRYRQGVPGIVGVVVSIVVLAGVAPPPVRGHGMVAADQVLASAAGATVLERGGNAVDAVVAAALAAGVVQPSASGLGGGGFALVGRSGPKDAVVLDFREVAPRGASRDMFKRADGSVIDRVGGIAVAVPAEARGLWELHERYGRLPAAEVARPAIALATDGFAVGSFLAGMLGRTSKTEVLALFSFDGRVATEGEVVRRQALGKTIARWVKSKGDVVNEGEGAAQVAAAIAETGGIVDAVDLHAYHPVDRTPIVGQYRGYTVVTMPPPSSGGLALVEMLGVLEGYDVKSLGHSSADHLHLLAEVMKHAYADRAHHLGDPDFVTVPVERLLSPERRLDIQRAIWPGRTFAPDYYGSLIAPVEDHGTEHISVLDEDGMAVALTTTINTTFGSGVVVEPLGIILNDQMDDFAVAPGVPNAYGLVGSEANAVAAGKRPLSSMTPTILYGPDGKVVMVVGASGGSQIISAVLQVVSNVVDFGMDASEAVSAPRLHAQWQPDGVLLDPGIPKEVIAGLEARGHKVTVQENASCSQVIVDVGGVRQGASDPRKGGAPVGVW